MSEPLPILSGVNSIRHLEICKQVDRAGVMVNHNDLIQRPTFRDYLIENAGSLPPLYLDSGAFQGRQSLGDYQETLDAFREIVEWYATLDSTDDSRESERHYDRLKALGYDPVWVAQPGVPTGRIRRYAHHKGLIGVGGLVGQSHSDQVRRIRRVAAICRERDCGLHVFSVSHPRVMNEINELEALESVDTSTWMVALRFGRALRRDGSQVDLHKRGLPNFEHEDVALANARQCADWIRGNGDWQGSLHYRASA